MKCVNLLVVLALVLALTLFFPFPSQVHAETEPNDTPGQANPIGIGWENAEINATISSTSDVDYFKFVACAGCTYVIETFEVHKISSSDGTGLWLYSTDGVTLLASDPYGSNGTGHADARVVHTFLAAGTYYIRVRRADFESWWGTYSLRVLPKYDEPGAGWDVSNDDEPNDEWQLANSLSVGRENTQAHQIHALNAYYVTHAADRDWYHFNAKADVEYVIETFNVANQGSYGTGLWLYDKDALLANDQYGSVGGKAGVWARIRYTFLTSGVYFVKVAPESYSSWTGAYSVRVCEGECLEHVFLPLVLRNAR
jgi:hypothetical protein